MTHDEAIKKAATALGTWVDTDGQMYSVDAAGIPTKTMRMPCGQDVRRAQSYIVHLLETEEVQ